VKAYLAIKYHPDGANRGLIEAISSVLHQAGIASVCVVRDLEQWGALCYEPGELMRLSLRELDACDLAVVDLSEKGVGLGIEAGYAYAKGLPVITIARQGADLSATLQGISQSVFVYQDVQDLAPCFATVQFE
jgi:2'-deoxynucleoside 5'-phosphate N-hydrolase